MTTGRIILAAAAVGIGLVLISRWRSSTTTPTAGAAAAPPPSTSQGFTATATATDFGPVVPQLAPAYALLKPIADNITTPLINDLNHAIGGADPYGGVKNIKQNPDGTFTGTDGLGATVTFNKDGTITRHYGSLEQQWQRSNVHTAVVAVGHAAVDIGDGVVSTAKNVKHWIGGLI